MHRHANAHVYNRTRQGKGGSCRSVNSLQFEIKVEANVTGRKNRLIKDITHKKGSAFPKHTNNCPSLPTHPDFSCPPNFSASISPDALTTYQNPAYHFNHPVKKGGMLGLLLNDYPDESEDIVSDVLSDKYSYNKKNPCRAELASRQHTLTQSDFGNVDQKMSYKPLQSCLPGHSSTEHVLNKGKVQNVKSKIQKGLTSRLSSLQEELLLFDRFILSMTLLDNVWHIVASFAGL